ncbi:MAG: EamA family transporter [Caldithrix sp.]|nr:EamA family transporter [Caldithrix sp.]
MYSENWILLGILTGIFFGFQTVFIKLLSKHYHQFEILSYLFIIAGFIILPFSLMDSWKIDVVPFIWSTTVSFVVNIAAFYLMALAVSRYPISTVMPFIGLTPLFLTLTGAIILDERIAFMGFISITMIVIGSFILQMPQRTDGKPVWHFKQFFNTKEKGIGLAILVAFLWSITASVEKIAVLSSTPAIYASIIHFALGIAFVVLSRFIAQKRADSYGRPQKIIPKELKLNVILLGLFSALLAINQLTAIKYAFVTYIISFKRAGIILSSIIGFVYFKESGVVKKLIGTIMIIAGTIIITL